MKGNFYNISFLTIISIIAMSCSTSKTIRFEVRDSAVLNSYKAQTNHVPVIEKNDIIEITLISSNEKFTKLFSSAVENNIRNQLTYTSGASARKGFLVELFFLSWRVSLFAHRDRQKCQSVRSEK